jgi:dTDP-4-amino-4,6-dideoxygalactose transaminase
MILAADPKAAYLAQKDIIDQTIREVMESGWYIMGPKVKIFEQHFAEYLGARHCVGVASGSDAVQLALRACGVESGDAVITVSHTAVATVSAIDWVGARPILVDISPVSYTISPTAVEETLRNSSIDRIKAIVAVHLYGHPAEMESLCQIATKHGVPLVEDCAQATGAETAGRKVGTIGDVAAFSFYPTKNLGAFGDGGAVVTNDVAIAEKIRLLQQYGWRERYISDEVGYNSRLDEIQAAILNCKLPMLDTGNSRRHYIAKAYSEGLAGLPIITPKEVRGCRHVYHQYVIRIENRDGLRKFLDTLSIKTGILYPMPIHLQPGYRERVTLGRGGITVTEEIANKILCLPIYPEMSDESVQQVIDGIHVFFDSKK